MNSVQRVLSKSFQEFFHSEKSSGVLLIACTLVSLSIANSPLGADYLGFWQAKVGGMSVEHWINDGLMAVFFLLIGLELERELHSGELSNAKNALLPVVAALGGILVPALIHFSLNSGTPTQAGHRHSDGDRHRLRARRAGAARRSHPRCAEGVRGRLRGDRRPGRDHCHRRVLHSAPFARLPAGGAGDVGDAVPVESQIPGDVACGPICLAAR